MLQGKLRLLVLKEEHDSPIASHRERENHHSNGVKEVLLATHEGKDSSLYENLCVVPSQPNQFVDLVLEGAHSTLEFN